MPLINLRSAFKEEPSSPDFILPGFLAGTVGALIAPGGTGKSIFALQIACSIACATANTLGFNSQKAGKVAYLNLEDPATELERRLFYLGTHFSEETKEQIISNLTLDARMGASLDLLTNEGRTALLKLAESKRLLIIDTLSRVHRLQENDNSAMVEVISMLDSITKETGAAILYLHHTSKAAVLAGQGGLAQAARGASALVDNARWCSNLRSMSEEEATAYSIPDRKNFVKYEIGKQNYGQADDDRWFERGRGGVFTAYIPGKKTKDKKKEWRNEL